MDASTKQWIVLKHDSSTRFHLLIWTLIETDNCNKTCWTQASLVAQPVKNLPAIQENWVPSLGWEDPLEKGKATHSSILAWRIPWTVQSMGSQRVRHDWVTSLSFLLALLTLLLWALTCLCLPEVLFGIKFPWPMLSSRELKGLDCLLIHAIKWPLNSTTSCIDPRILYSGKYPHQDPEQENSNPISRWADCKHIFVCVFVFHRYLKNLDSGHI